MPAIRCTSGNLSNQKNVSDQLPAEGGRVKRKQETNSPVVWTTDEHVLITIGELRREAVDEVANKYGIRPATVLSKVS